MLRRVGALARKPTPEGEAWIAARRDKRVPLGDAEIIVTALLAAGRGDADTARQLMRSTAEMVENHPLVRELAGEWLAVDAVAARRVGRARTPMRSRRAGRRAR